MKGCSLSHLYKSSRERLSLFKEASLILYNDNSRKNVLTLIRLYEKNYDLIKKKLPAEIITKKPNGSTENEDWLGEIGKAVVTTFGNKMSLEELFGKPTVSDKVYKVFCKQKKWKLKNPKNKKKFEKTNGRYFYLNLLCLQVKKKRFLNKHIKMVMK